MNFFQLVMGFFLVFLGLFGSVSAKEGQTNFYYGISKPVWEKPSAGYVANNNKILFKANYLIETQDVERTSAIQDNFKVFAGLISHTNLWFLSRMRLEMVVDAKRTGTIVLGIVPWKSDREAIAGHIVNVNVAGPTEDRWQALSCEIDLSNFPDGFYKTLLYVKSNDGMTTMIGDVFLSAANGSLHELLEKNIPDATVLKTKMAVYDPFLLASVGQLASDARESLHRVVGPEKEPTFQCAWSSRHVEPPRVEK
ncbi:MAG: hypothetical protein V1495_05280 [Pseudomonadota bacterium]